MHLVPGVLTNIVTVVDVSGWEANDCSYFMPMVETTAQHFALHDVSVDKTYLSRANLSLVNNAGGTVYIPFKDDTAVPASADDSLWARIYHYDAFNRHAILDRYHKRTNVESTYSMIKGKFGDAAPSKSDTGEINEGLCKVLCHNICVIIQSMHKFGIETTFVPTMQTA